MKVFETILLVLSIFAGLEGGETVQPERKIPEPVIVQTQFQEGEIIRVVDGDTYEVFLDKKEKVRLIGIDTPESVSPDKEKNREEGIRASDYAKELLEGKIVEVEFDVQERDRYGRILAYLYLEDKMVNEILLEEGMAQVSTYPPNIRYAERFTELERKAREEGKGFWSGNTDVKTVDPEDYSNLIKGNINRKGEKIYHMPGQRDYHKTKINEANGEKWFISEEEAIAAGFRKAKN